MNSGRIDLLIPILDELGANDERLFHEIEQEVFNNPPESERAFGASLAFPLSQAFTDKIGERAREIFLEMERVLGGGYFEDFDELSETLKKDWVRRLEAMANVASTQFQSTAQMERESLSFLQAVSEDSVHLPPQTMFSDHVEKLKVKWFAEIELSCVNLTIAKRQGYS